MLWNLTIELFFIDFTDRAMLSDEEVWNAFTYSFKLLWLNIAKELDFMNDKTKFLNCVNTKFEEELNKCDDRNRSSEQESNDETEKEEFSSINDTNEDYESPQNHLKNNICHHS